MPRYIIERTVGSLTEEELNAAGKRSNEEIQDRPAGRSFSIRAQVFLAPISSVVWYSGRDQR